jgi:hypothetical protein
MFNKKAQTGETLTWFIATIIIIVILGIAISVTQFVIKGGETSFVKTHDVVAIKSLTAYLLTGTEEGLVYNQLQNEDNLNDLNGNLAINIFENIYRKNYPAAIWLGIFDGDSLVEQRKGNSYFVGPPSMVTVSGSGPGPGKVAQHISDKILLKENKYLEIILVEEYR